MVQSVRGLALLSGFLGAAASCFAKFAFDPELQVVDWVHSSCPSAFYENRPTASEQQLSAVRTTVLLTVCKAAELAPRGLFLLAMIACNAAMLSSFLQGMQESGSVAGTALSSSANFATSALLGALLFSERFPVQWWLGFSMVVTGAMLLATVRVRPKGSN